jgi:hypothetical protein
MRRRALILAALLLGVAAASAREERLPPSKLPKPIADAVQARFPDAVVKSASKEADGEAMYYEVSIKQNDRHIDVTLTPEGEIAVIETTIDRSDLPDAVTSALADNYPEATYRAVEEVVEVDGTQERLVYYEIELVAADKSKHEVRITPDGASMTEADDEGDGEDEG